MQINWENFSAYNHDARGIRFKFEDLCRQLFVNENISGNKRFRYLHANPNNYGLETEPIFDEVRQMWIGFQAKYFENAVDYDQIEESVKKIVEYYTGNNGVVNHVFLFSNKPITSNATGFVRALKLLKDNNIELELVTDNAILDIIRSKYEYLGEYYFGNHYLSTQWFHDHNKDMYDILGERYNRLFHIDTSESNELSLFVNDQNAAKYLNAKKAKTIEAAKNYYSSNQKHREYLSFLIEKVAIIPDVTVETLFDSLDWNNIICKELQSYITDLTLSLQDLEHKREKCFESLSICRNNNEDQQEYENEVHFLNTDISEIRKLLDMVEILKISDREANLLKNSVLLVLGNAGTGKSQLLAHEAQLLYENNQISLLLVSGIYYNNDPIQKQIMDNMDLDYSFSDLIDILETIGEKTNRIIPIFIDALNETGNYRLWKKSLSSIIDKVNQSCVVKLVLTYRAEYEKLVLPDTIIAKKKNNEYVSILHNGFADTGVDAVKEFLNHYNIPFSPLEYFRYEMANPLFLTLYCKTYNGTDAYIPQLYDRLIESVNHKLYHSLCLSQNGYTEDINILKPLIIEIASVFLSNHRRYMTEDELSNLDYWRKNNLSPLTVIHHLKVEGVLHTYVFDDQEELFFSFDQMNDYFCAETIFKSNHTKEEIQAYLLDNLLGIKNGKIEFYNNISIFINCCELYSKKFHEECLDIIDSIWDEESLADVCKYYIDSFQWRRHICLSTEQFTTFCNEHPAYYQDIWTMLLGNSVKTNHIFNADFLHSILSKFSLCDRDYFWTTFINGLSSSNDERIVQLIKLYNKGDNLDFINPKQIELLLTLFSWLLTSSNRWLRDNTSKAMIEILKQHFQFCQVILNKFKNVNDPYVGQRLYGIVFGACCKRLTIDEQCFTQLAEYIYSTVFDQEKVYADILLRDYARLIIERFLHEFPDYTGIIKRKKIMPPYSSEPIPEIEDQHYLEDDYTGATYSIISSMRFDGMGWYGDFGRYVFQSALRNFNVDENKIFNYAIFHIIHELGFSEEYFKDYDMFCHNYDRHQTIKTERIGKKYQWITMYNVLARVSDNCEMRESWHFNSDNIVEYEGPWEPYVRDFDPTLNSNFLMNEDAPIFSILNEHREKSIEEHRNEVSLNIENQEYWINKKGYFLEKLKHTLILTDESKTQWVFLKKFCDTDRHSIDVDKLHEWSWLYAYFMNPSQVELCRKYIKKSKSVLSSEIASHFEKYTIYNREYPWAPSCREIVADTWMDCIVNTGEYEKINSNSQKNELSFLEQLLRNYSLDEDILKDNSVDAQANKDVNNKPQLKEIKKNIGRILTSTVELLWEEEYDASKENTITICHPCPKLIQDMNLQQEKNDGYYYDDTGKLAAFDTSLTQKTTGVLVRKDILDEFLSLNDFRLVWFIDAEKAVHPDENRISMLSRWKGLFIYSDGTIEGDIYKIKK